MPLTVTPAVLAQVAGEAAARIARGDGMSKDPDLIEIHAMLIQRGEQPDRPGHFLYDCRNQLPGGDCGIYESRPFMCRNYPTDPAGCQRPDCTSELYAITARDRVSGEASGRGRPR
jgi:Fe-S-cluster containining protein